MNMKVNNEKPMNYERPQDRYEEFEKAVRENFSRVVESNKHLYQVKVDGLWETYLYNLPEDGRFVYDCRACKHFIERYGNLVTIADDGHVESALWYLIDVPPYFAESVLRMNNLVRNSNKIHNVFISDVRTLGTPKTGIWTHMHAVLPTEMVNHSRVKNAGQLMAEKTEDFKMLLNAIQEYPVNVVEQAVALLQTKAMYRSEKVLGIAEWFLKVHKSLEGKTGTYRTNLIWKAVGEAPNGFCHVKSSMIGTLLDDIVAGYSTRVIMARFEEKMDPQNYMRSRSAPTAAAIEQAEKLVEKLGIANSLRRRYARFDEVADRCVWRPKGPLYKFLEKESKKSSGVFGNVVAKDRSPQNDISLDLPVTTMTWDKFSRTVLPGAVEIEAKIENSNRFMALVTEAVLGSPNILNWNNPFSWYYHGGIDGEIKRRVEAAGGRYENCEIRCSLIWNNYTDLDIHCITPYGGHMYYGHKNSAGGYLDVDANGGSHRTPEPVENIRWIDHAPNGHYLFYVHNYYDRNNKDNPYRVELEVGGKIYSREGFMTRTDEQHIAFEFDYLDGVVSNLIFGNETSDATGSEMWNLNMGDFVKVKGILKSPNMWDEKSGSANGEHTFFILDGCKDTSEGLGRGFFNEILKPELREIRKTLEAYSASTPIECAETADACGIGFTTDSEWDVVLRVTMDSGNVRLIKIDRFD